MKISIITASFNSSKTIGSTLLSVANQSYTSVEHIIIDGASRDSSIEIVKKHGTVAKLIVEPDRGMYDAMNKGLRCATGDVIGILNSDDFYLHNDVLKQVADAFLADPTLDVVMGDVDFVEGSDLTKTVRIYKATGFAPWMFRFGFMPPHPGVFVRKSAYDRIGEYKLGYKIAADFDFLLRLLLIDGAKYQASGKHWVRMLTGGASTSGWRSNFVITKEMQRSLLENNVFSSMPMLLLRLPVKFFGQMNLCNYF